ncbi:energy transducer TonB, partial [Serratia marcescens]
MLSQSYSLPAFELPQPRAQAAHAALVLLFYWPQT